MQIPLQITLHDIEYSESLDNHIRRYADKLEKFFEHVISCRVVVGVSHRLQHQGKQYKVHLDIGVPGGEIIVNRDHSEAVDAALRDAFEEAYRRIGDHSREFHGNVKSHNMVWKRVDIDDTHIRVIDDR